MKQHITKEQLLELTNKQLEKFLIAISPEKRILCGSYDEELLCKGITIGVMIEFLGDEWTRNAMEDLIDENYEDKNYSIIDNLSDILWINVIYKLREIKK